MLNKRWITALVASLLVHIALMQHRPKLPSIVKDRPDPSAVKISVKTTPKTTNTVAPSSKPVTKVKPNPASPKKTGNAQPKAEAASYRDLLPTSAEGMAMMAGKSRQRGEGFVSGIEEFDVPAGTGALLSDALTLVINIPDQLSAMYSSARATIKLERLNGDWHITHCKGEHFYRALLYERIKPLIRKGQALYRLLESLGRSVFWISIEYLRQTSLIKDEITREWRQTDKKLVLHVEEWRIPKEAKVFSMDEDDDGTQALLLDVIGAAKLAKDLIVGEAPTPLDRTMRVLKESPAYGKNCTARQ